MYLRNVRLRHWACHEELAIDLAEGLNLCVGPNGVGKSTLYQAILTALTHKHTAKNETLQEFRAWGRAGFGPTVKLDVVRADGPWRLTKTFLDEPSCTLDRWQDGRWAADSRGKPAEQKIDGWFEADGAAGRLMMALWSSQDDSTRLYSTNDRAEKAGRVASLERFLAGPAEGTTGPFATMKRRVEQSYLQIFTPERAQIRKGSAQDKARRRAEEARTRSDDCRRRRDDLAERVDTYQARLADHREQTARLDELRRAMADLSGQLDETRRRREAVVAAREAADTARSRMTKLAEDDRKARDLADEIARLDRDLAALVPALASARFDADRAANTLQQADDRCRNVVAILEQATGAIEILGRLDEFNRHIHDRQDEFEAADERAGQARQRLDRSESAIAAARADLDLATRHLAYLLARDRDEAVRRTEAAARAAEERLRLAEVRNWVAERTRLTDRLARWQGLRDESLGIDRQLGNRPIPTRADLEAIRSESRDLAVHESTMAADSLLLRFEPEGDGSLHLELDGLPTAEARFEPGQVVEHRAVARLDLVIAGLGRLSIARTSATELEERLARVREAKVTYEANLRRWQVTELTGLDDRLRLAERRQQIAETMDTLLDGRSHHDETIRLTELTRAIERSGAAIATQDDDWATPVPIDRLRDRRDEAQLALEKARAAVEAAGFADVIETGPLLPIGTVHESRSACERSKTHLVAAEEAARQHRADWNAADLARQVAQQLNDQAHQELDDACHGQFDIEYQRATNDLEGYRQQLALHLGDRPALPTREATRLIRKDQNDKVESARSRLETDRNRVTQIDRDYHVAKTARERAERTRSELRREITDLDDPDSRSARLDEARREVLRREATVRLLEDQMPDDPEPEFLRASAESAEAEDACRALEIELNHRRGGLDELGSEGLDTQVAETEQALGVARGELAAADRDAAACAILHHLVAEVESAQAQGVARKIEELAGATIPRLTGHDLGPIRMNPDDLSPRIARVASLGIEARIERFSRGTREQVALGCRMAIGRLMSRDHRHLLLLDDPLTHTDASRHRESLELLADLAADVQIVLFTCHPDRLGEVVDLDAVRRIDIARPSPAPADAAAAGDRD